jgi:hypothetical protein
MESGSTDTTGPQETQAVQASTTKAATIEKTPLVPSMLPVGDPLLRTDGVPGGGNLDGGALIFQQQDEPELETPDAASYQFYITDLENRFGAYAPGLSEQLLGLGNAYLDQGLYQRAAKVFKRAVHLSRINNGLHSAEQIPMLQGMISALVSSGEYEEADERQYYPFRIQRQLYKSNDPAMSQAMLDRADWERQAYYLSIGDTAFGRLLNMWELYRRVLSNIAEAEGNYSIQLLKPLNGLLETQYLIARYNGEAPSGIQVGNPSPETTAEENRFSMVRMSNYKQGQAVIAAIREVYLFNESENSSRATEALLELGDWRQYHNKRKEAAEAYQQAWDEFATMENSEAILARHFGAPVMLPNTADAHTDLAPPADIRGYAEVSYTVTERGRVDDLELVSNTVAEGYTEAEPTRLLRRLKVKKFRPHYVNRQPVTTENLVNRYAY